MAIAFPKTSHYQIPAQQPVLCYKKRMQLGLGAAFWSFRRKLVLTLSSPMSQWPQDSDQQCDPPAQACSDWETVRSWRWGSSVCLWSFSLLTVGVVRLHRWYFWCTLRKALIVVRRKRSTVGHDESTTGDAQCHDCSHINVQQFCYHIEIHAFKISCCCCVILSDKGSEFRRALSSSKFFLISFYRFRLHLSQLLSTWHLCHPDICKVSVLMSAFQLTDRYTKAYLILSLQHEVSFNFPGCSTFKESG